jgi:mono/diheme cytochrome c family protein
MATRLIGHPVFRSVIVLVSIRSWAAAQPGAPSGDRERLADAARAIFTEHCARCHGPEAPRPKGGIGYITDLAAVARGSGEAGKLVDIERPESSRVYATIAKGIMPHDAEKPLPAEVAAAVLAWIRAGAPAVQAAAAGGSAVAPAEILQAVHADLDGVRKSRPEGAASARYLTLAHLLGQKGVDRGELEACRRGFETRLASLAGKAAVVPLVAVAGTHDTVFRLDLADLGWSAERWEGLAAGYPYGAGSGGGGPALILRGDWLAAAPQLAGLKQEPGEPERALRERYLQAVTLEAAAAELGVTAEELRKRASGSPEFAPLARDLETGGVPRERFAAAFKRLAEALGRGASVDPAAR